MRQLTSLDAQFLSIESDTHTGHVSGLAIFDPSTAPGGNLGLDAVRKLLSERLHLLPPLRWKLAPVPLGLDLPYWVDDAEFDLDFHIRELALPGPGDERQLGEQVARIHARRLDRARPLWELYLIQGYGDGNVAVMTKMHHAMIDGMSGAEIMGVLFDLEPGGREIPAPDPDAESPTAPDGGTMLTRGLVGLAMQPVRMARSLPQTVAHLDVFPSVLGIPGAETISRNASRARNFLAGSRDGEIVERPRMRAPKTAFNTKISAHRRFGFGSVPLADVKRVKGHFGVKVNDVVMSLCSAAVREWLLAHDDLPDDSLLAQIPVSVRSEEQFGTYGNRVSIMIVPIATEIDDPVERLRAINGSMQAAKTRHNALPASALQDFSNFIPPAVSARAARVALQLGTRQGMRPLYNLVISNVPGPPFPLYMGGALLLANYPVSVVTDAVGLNITVLSYRDSVDIGIITDREQIDDPWSMVDGMKRELAALLALCD